MKPESTCTEPGCNAPLIWGVTEFDRRMPLDPDPTPDGRVIRVRRRDGNVRLHVLTGDELPWVGDVTDDAGPFMPHHRTCVAADRFRGPPPGLRCRVCRGPMNAKVTAIEGTDTHPCCDPAPGAERVRKALQAVGKGQAALDLDTSEGM